jgi:hypothetical protein
MYGYHLQSPSEVEIAPLHTGQNQKKSTIAIIPGFHAKTKYSSYA